MKVVFQDSYDQPWKVILTWLELRYDLATVALFQVKDDSIVWCAAQP